MTPRRTCTRGTHHVQHLNIQVAGTLAGVLLATSDRVSGRRHASAALQLWHPGPDLEVTTWAADTASISTGAITPITKIPGSDRLEWENTFNPDMSIL